MRPNALKKISSQPILGASKQRVPKTNLCLLLIHYEFVLWLSH